jgi:hypothetical protein
MKLGRAFSVRLPLEAEAYLETVLAQQCPGTKMADILRPIIWDWYQSKMEGNGKDVSLPTDKKTPKAKSA